MNEELKNIIALSQVKDIGPVSAQELLRIFKTATNVFKAKKSELLHVNGLGAIRANALKLFTDWDIVEKELKFIESQQINCLSIDSEFYPKYLKNCVDAPIILYYKGNLDALKSTKIISIIGKRLCTDYGRKILDIFIKELCEYNVLIVSGLAIGIDVYAHKQALINNLPTIGVLAHGLDTIYPSQHKSIAKEMQVNGGLLTEYISKTKPDRENFPTRNRIVAGMSECTVVVETDIKGGSIITANLANGYNKDVMAFPGNINNVHSSGCNYLIKTNKAHLITEAKDLIDLLNWAPKLKAKKPQRELFINLNANEQLIIDILNKNGNLHTDALCHLAQMPPSTFAVTTINLEMQNLICMLPAKIYKLVE